MKGYDARYLVFSIRNDTKFANFVQLIRSHLRVCPCFLSEWSSPITHVSYLTKNAMSCYTKICEEAARAGGRELLKMLGSFNVREKGPADLVTNADLASQKAIFSVISAACPDHELLGEESEDTTFTPKTSGPTWIVDPLDGTTNYVHNLENYCVSVALHEAGELQVGVVYDPVRDHCYRATRGQGAYLNDIPIQSSQVTSISDSLISASFSPRVARDSPEIERFLRVLTAAQAVRRLGSAALNLCYVASGRLDAYWASNLKAWDVAAGFLILQEAGGCLSPLTKSATIELAKPQFIATGHVELGQRMQEIFSET